MVITTGAAISDKNRERDAEARAMAQVGLRALESSQLVFFVSAASAIVQSLKLRPWQWCGVPRCHAQLHSSTGLGVSALALPVLQTFPSLRIFVSEHNFRVFLGTSALSGRQDCHEAVTATHGGVMQEKNRHRLRIPRRPKWNQDTTGEQLDAAERESFLQWRRALAKYACTRQACAK